MDTLDDFFEAETKARETADSRVTPDQILSPGDYCIRVISGITIYSEILDAAAFFLGNRSLDDLEVEEREEYDDTRTMYAEPHMKYYRFTRSYSAVCPSGEYGDCHLSEVTKKISRNEFERAKKAGWS